MHEVELSRAGLIDFGEFLDITYDVDGKGEVHLGLPDFYSDFEIIYATT